MAHQITPESEDLYDARIRTLRRHSPGLKWSQPEAWAAAIAARKLALSSLKSYASAVRFGARRDDERSAPTFIKRFDAALEPSQIAVRKTKQRARPKHRRVAITEEAVEILRKAAEWREENTRSTRSQLAMDIAEGTLRFGLRPSEWSKAKSDANSLIIQNGKHAVFEMEHGPFAGRVYRRGNGRSRELLGNDEFVRRFRPILRRIAEAGPLGYRTNERAIRRAWRENVETAIKRFGLPARYRHLRLYDFRHQFAANWKKAVPASTGIVAALMGHASVRTAVQSYARGTNARGTGWGLRPSAESLDAVVTHDIWDGYPVDRESKPSTKAQPSPVAPRQPGRGPSR